MKISKLLKNQDGASAVEFAIVLPLFLVLTFGIIEFGVIMYNKAILTNASREGARFGILFNKPVHTTAQIETRVEKYLKNGDLLINLGGPKPDTDSISIDPITDTRLFGAEVRVKVNFSYDFLLLPSFIPFITDPLDLSCVTIMRQE